MPKVITLHSYRGGAGKTVVAAHLAALLCARGRRVALVDADLRAPGLHVVFGLEDAALGLTLNDYLGGRCDIGEVAREVGIEERGSADGALYIVPASLKPGHIARVLREEYDLARLHEGVQRLLQDQAIDHVIIDTHAGFNEEALLAMAVSEILLLILRPDRQDHLGTAAMLDVARTLRATPLLLLNKVMPSSDAARLEAEVQLACRAPVAATLRLCTERFQLGSRAVADATDPAHPFTQVLGSVVDQLIGSAAPRRSPAGVSQSNGA